MDVHVYYHIRNFYTGIILHYINIFNFYVTFKCFERGIKYVITIFFPEFLLY